MAKMREARKLATYEGSGRPSKYDSIETIKQCETYIANCQEAYRLLKSTDGKTTEKILTVNLPTLGGLALFLGIDKDTITEWAKTYLEFSVICKRIKLLQEQRLLEGGLSGRYNSRFGELILKTHHGYSDKVLTQEVSVTDEDTMIHDDVKLDRIIKEVEQKLKDVHKS